MTTPATPSNPQSTGNDPKLVAVNETNADTFEDKLQLFWEKNGKVVIGVCVLVLLVIVGKGVWEHFAKKKELEIEQAYAAATTSEQLKSFAAAHPDHTLAGISHLRLADEAYAADKSADAQAAYEKAIAVLKEGPLVARAKLGLALTKVQAGKAAEGAADLKQLANDATQLKAVRAEAMYHLASLSAQAGNATEVQTFSDQLMQLDPSSPWAQRAMALRASLPAPAEAPAPATAPEKKDDSSPSVQLKLPGN